MEWLVVLAVAAAFGLGYWTASRKMIGDQQQAEDEWARVKRDRHWE